MTVDNSLLEGQSNRECVRERMLLDPPVQSLNACMEQGRGSRWSQEMGMQSRSPARVAGAQLLESSLLLPGAAYARTLEQESKLCIESTPSPREGSTPEHLKHLPLNT